MHPAILLINHLPFFEANPFAHLNFAVQIFFDENWNSTFLQSWHKPHLIFEIQSEYFYIDQYCPMRKLHSRLDQNKQKQHIPLQTE